MHDKYMLKLLKPLQLFLEIICIHTSDEHTF